MSSKESAYQRERAKAEANSKNIENFGSQLFSNQRILSNYAPDSSTHDEVKMSNFPASCLLGILGLRQIGIVDERDDILDFVDALERAFNGVNGNARKDAVTIISAMLGSGKNKPIQRKSWVQRNVTQRGQPEFSEVDGDAE